MNSTLHEECRTEPALDSGDLGICRWLNGWARGAQLTLYDQTCFPRQLTPSSTELQLASETGLKSAVPAEQIVSVHQHCLLWRDCRSAVKLWQVQVQ